MSVHFKYDDLFYFFKALESGALGKWKMLLVRDQGITSIKKIMLSLGQDRLSKCKFCPAGLGKG